MEIFRTQVDSSKYFVVDYYLESKTNLRDAAWSLAIGQSIGNPDKRSKFETEQLFQDHSCIILHNELELALTDKGNVRIAFPVVNIDLHTDGISHLLCMIFGGQLDIDIIIKCQVKNIEFTKEQLNCFKGPKFGLKGVREFTKTFGKPLIGGIVKPKTGISPQMLLEIVQQMVEGGVQFIKEDEILAYGTPFCPLEERVPLISNYLKGKNVVYCFAINADPLYVLERAKFVHEHGGNGIHVNVHAGLGVYKSLRDLDLPLFIHLQKSGDKLFTNKNHDFHIDWKVVVKLCILSGCDLGHATMFGGYMSETEEEVREILDVFHKFGAIPALSCGMNPNLVKPIVDKFGNDVLLNSGGFIHSHKDGTKAGVEEMVKAVNKVI